MAVDWDISYSLQYLNDYVRNLNLQPQVRNLIPFAEFTYEQVVRTRYAGTPPDLAVLPGVAYMTDTWQVSVATALALNHATVEFDHAAVITMLSITLDKIFPPPVVRSFEPSAAGYDRLLRLAVSRPPLAWLCCYCGPINAHSLAVRGGISLHGFHALGAVNPACS